MTSSQACLEPRGLLGPHAQALALAALGHGDVGADVEEVVLDPPQPLAVALRQVGHRERDADLRVELVDGAVGLDPRVRLGHPAHVAEMRLAVVAEARVDAGQIDGHGASRTVTSRPIRPRSVDREAGVRPARTRHCDRGCRTRAARESRIHWPAACGLGRSVRSARKPGDLPPTTKPRTLVEGVALRCTSSLSGLLAGVALLIAAPARAAPVTVDLRVEGPSATLVPQDRSPDVQPVRSPGRRRRTAATRRDSAGAGARVAPPRGDWSGRWRAVQRRRTIRTIRGERSRLQRRRTERRRLGALLAQVPLRDRRRLRHAECGDAATRCCSSPTASAGCTTSPTPLRSPRSRAPRSPARPRPCTSTRRRHLRRGRQRDDDRRRRWRARRRPRRGRTFTTRRRRRRRHGDLDGRSRLRGVRGDQAGLRARRDARTSASTAGRRCRRPRATRRAGRDRRSGCARARSTRAGARRGCCAAAWPPTRPGCTR